MKAIVNCIIVNLEKECCKTNEVLMFSDRLVRID